MLQVVLCRYDETAGEMNQEFLNSKNTLLYNKGKNDISLSPGVSVINTENVGREVHAYLYHIVHNWDNLADVTLFSQCRTDDHPNILSIDEYASTTSFKAVVENQGVGFLTCNPQEGEGGWAHVRWPEGRWSQAFEGGAISPSPYTLKEFYQKYVCSVLPEEDKCVTLLYGTFSVTRTCIRQKPVEYFRTLLDVVSRHQQPEEIHYLERLWAYVFLPVESLNRKFQHLQTTDVT